MHLDFCITCVHANTRACRRTSSSGRPSWPIAMFSGKPAAVQAPRITAFFSSSGSKQPQGKQQQGKQQAANAQSRPPLAAVDNTAASVQRQQTAGAGICAGPSSAAAGTAAPAAAGPPPPLNKAGWRASSSHAKPPGQVTMYQGFFPHNFPVWCTLPGTRWAGAP
jgi:hypothetical protein